MQLALLRRCKPPGAPQTRLPEEVLPEGGDRGSKCRGRGWLCCCQHEGRNDGKVGAHDEGADRPREAPGHIVGCLCAQPRTSLYLCCLLVGGWRGGEGSSGFEDALGLCPPSKQPPGYLPHVLSRPTQTVTVHWWDTVAGARQHKPADKGKTVRSRG